MALTQIIVSAILQGIAEVLPISRAGHTALLDAVTDWSALTPMFHLAVQTGALLGIMAYFWQDLWEMATGVARALKGKRDQGASLAAQIGVATIPVLALGSVFTRHVGFDAHSLVIIGWAAVAGAVLLFALDHLSMTVKRVEHATFWDIALIGIMQVAVLIPGAGRVAMMVTMARFLGYERVEAARLSMLLAIPVLVALSVRDAIELGGVQAIPVTNADIFGGVIGASGGLIAAAALMAWLKRSSFLPFVIYRLVLGGMILVLAYGWIPA